jgi:hypothetical protein
MEQYTEKSKHEINEECHEQPTERNLSEEDLHQVIGSGGEGSIIKEGLTHEGGTASMVKGGIIQGAAFMAGGAIIQAGMQITANVLRKIKNGSKEK